MNPQPRTRQEQDVRHERLSHAQKTGEYVDFPGGGGIPVRLYRGRVCPLPGYVEAAKRRRNIQTSKQEIENGMQNMS